MNERGAGLIALLALLPLIVAIVATTGSSYLLMRSDGELRHLCRVELLNAQTKVSNLLEQLMSINPEAKRLRALEKEALAEAAAPPPLNAPAIARLQVIRASQFALASKQVTLLTQGKLLSRTAPAAAVRLLVTRLHRASSVNGEDPSPLGFTKSVEPGAFDIVASPADSLTPDYEPATNFSETQTMRLRWQFDAAAIVPGWAREILRFTAIKARGQCAATLEKGKKWEAKLSADKS